MKCAWPSARDDAGRDGGRIAGWLALWIVAATLKNLFRYDVDDAFGLLGAASWLLLWGGFVAILIPVIRQAGKGRGAWPSWLLVVSVIATGLVFQRDGRTLDLQFRFRRHRASYEAVVRDLVAGRDPGRDVEYRVDPGPPVRVAFPWPGGILDNWSAIVYDPTGLVLQARLLKSDLSDLHAAKFGAFVGLFGGDLCYCQPLGGGWYFCGFT